MKKNYLKIIYLKFLSLVCIVRMKKIREAYWDWRSNELLKSYDDSNYDSLRILNIINTFGCKEVHDLGCGPGRLMRLWNTIPSEVHIVATDISQNSIQTAKSKSQRNVEFIRLDLVNDDLVVPQARPAIASVNKVLGALDRSEVKIVISKLMCNYTYVYLCENFMSDDSIKESIAWRIHDYHQLIEISGGEIIQDDKYYLVFKGQKGKF